MQVSSTLSRKKWKTALDQGISDSQTATLELSDGVCKMLIGGSTASFWFSGSKVKPNIILISNKFPGDVEVSGSEAKSEEVLESQTSIKVR